MRRVELFRRDVVRGDGAPSDARRDDGEDDMVFSIIHYTSNVQVSSATNGMSTNTTR
eukprot:m.89539 g.89539  ORF g.89539 m.89539 type:complete len:57 (+) comp12898_c0_seq2:1853-2023(+)